MWSRVTFAFVATGLIAQVPPLPETGFRPIFNASSLDGWDCDPDFWRATGGSIVGETTAAHQPKQNTFCIWKGGYLADFDLKLQYRISGEATAAFSTAVWSYPRWPNGS
jgi:hypothetical protein